MDSALKPAAKWPFPTKSEAPAGADMFVPVPDTTLPGGLFVPAFQVARYHASVVDGKLAVTGEGSPLVSVSFHRAKEMCAEAGYALITESQALSLAWNLSQCERNWISGVLLSGRSMYQGLHLDLDDADECKPFDFVSPDATERREFYLPDGSMVLDAAGNVYTWVFDDVQGDENGIVARAFAADSPSITTAPYPSMKNGVGYYPSAGTDWSCRALIRGGCWYSDDAAGVFRLYCDWPVFGNDGVGVRCTKPIGA